MHKIIYYEEDNGKTPIIDFLRDLPRKDRAKVLWEIDLLKEFGTNLSMPHVKKMSSYDNLWVKSAVTIIVYFTFTILVITLSYFTDFRRKHKKRQNVKLKLQLKEKTVTSKGMINMNHDQVKELLFTEDPELKVEFDALTPIYELQKEVIQMRLDAHLSQKELAELVGTKQSAISRLEGGNYNPSIEFLSKIAHALGKECHVTFK